MSFSVLRKFIIRFNFFVLYVLISRHLGYSYIRQILYWNFFRSTTQLTYLDFRYLSLCNIPPIQASRLLLHWSRLLCQRSGNCVLRQYIIVHIFSFDSFRLSVYDSHHSRSCSIKLSHYTVTHYSYILSMVTSQSALSYLYL